MDAAGAVIGATSAWTCGAPEWVSRYPAQLWTGCSDRSCSTGTSPAEHLASPSRIAPRSSKGSSAPRRSLPTNPPAHRVRFKVDDIVLALNGQPVSNRADLSYLLTRDMINKPVPVTVLRNDRRMEFAAPVSLYRVPGAVYRERPRS